MRLAQETLPISAEQVQGWVTQTAHAALQTAAALSGDLVLGVAGTVVEFVLTLFILFFLLLDGRVIIRHVAHLVPMQGDRRNTLINNLVAVMKAVVYGTAMTALIQGGADRHRLCHHRPALARGLRRAGGRGVFHSGNRLRHGTVPAILYLMVVGRWGAAIFLWSGPASWPWANS